MKRNIKPKAYIYPLPVLIIGTYDEAGVPNAMNAAWGTVCDYDKVSICLAKNHKTVANVLKANAFTVAMADVENAQKADYVGVVSAFDVPDKIKNVGWTVVNSQAVNAPIFIELPLTLECEVVSYDENSEILVGKVVNATCDEEILTDGKIDLNKFHPVCYDTDTHGYYAIGDRVGNAFADGLKLKN